MTTMLISDIFPPKTGGSGRWFWEIYRRLPRQDFLIAAGEDPRQDTFDQTHDLRVTRLPLNVPSRNLTDFDGLKHYFRAVQALRELVRGERIGMIHCGRCLPEGLMGRMFKWWTGVPYAVYAHGEDVNIAAARKSSGSAAGGILESRQLRWLTGRVLRGADQVIANSQNTRRILTQDWRLPDEHVHLLYPGVDTRRFVPAPRRIDVRNRLGWRERPVILTVSRLQERKGQDRMIQALSAIRQTVSDVLYALVGDGEKRAGLARLTADLELGGHVQFLDEIDDRALVECYQQCDILYCRTGKLEPTWKGSAWSCSKRKRAASR